MGPPPCPASPSPESPRPAVPQTPLEEARAILWDKVGIIRNGKQLSEAVKRLQDMHVTGPHPTSRDAFEAVNILDVARLIARCALAREESRGAHYRSDFPLKNDNKSPRHTYITNALPPYFV